MEDIAQSVNKTGAYSLEFEPQCVLSIRYWKLDKLVKVQLSRYSMTFDPGPSQLLLVAQFIPFLSVEPQIACLSGCTSEVLQTIEQAPISEKGVEYPFRFKALSLPEIMHQKEGCVFGRIDFYTQLKYLIAFLNNSLDEPWMATCPELSKVRNGANFPCTHHFYSCISTSYPSFSAITNCELRIRSLPALCSEIITNWQPFLDHIIKIAPSYEMIGVKNKVISHFVLLIPISLFTMA